jgi:hypothetical protein
MSAVKNDSKKMRKKSSANPFVKAAEDEKNISAAIQNGKSLSTLKEIKFVKPI